MSWQPMNPGGWRPIQAPAPRPDRKLEQLHTSSAQVDEVITTNETTSSTAYTDLATVGPEVTVNIGLPGMLMVGLYARIIEAGADNNFMSFALSGANTQAADDGYALMPAPSEPTLRGERTGATFVLTGLTPGPTTVTAKYRDAAASGNGAWRDRRLFAIPL